MSIYLTIRRLTRRFEQYQEDCNFTVLALLPTATEHILEELPVEKLTQELQQKKAARIAKCQSITDAGSEVSGFPQKEDDTQSLQSFASESFVMAAKEGEERPRKSKAKLWDEIKISCMMTLIDITTMELTIEKCRYCSPDKISHTHLHSRPPHDPNPSTTQPPRPQEISFLGRLQC